MKAESSRGAILILL